MNQSAAAALPYSGGHTEAAEWRGGVNKLVASVVGCTCLSDAKVVSVDKLLFVYSVLTFSQVNNNIKYKTEMIRSACSRGT